MILFVCFDVYICISGFKNVNVDNLFSSSGLILQNDYLLFFFILFTDLMVTDYTGEMSMSSPKRLFRKHFYPSSILARRPRSFSRRP